MPIVTQNVSVKEDLIALHSDLYKDVYGIRPRWYDYSKLFEDALIKEIESLEKELEKVIVQENEIELINIKAFEAMVEDTIKAGASDRSTAVRWMHDAHETDGDNEYLCFLLGIPYGYITE